MPMLDRSDCCIKFTRIMAAKDSNLFFLILKFPIKDGIETYGKICNFYKDIHIIEPKIIVVTGYSFGSEMVQLAFEKGIQKIIANITNDLIKSLVKLS